MEEPRTSETKVEELEVGEFVITLAELQGEIDKLVARRELIRKKLQIDEFIKDDELLGYMKEKSSKR